MSKGVFITFFEWLVVDIRITIYVVILIEVKIIQTSTYNIILLAMAGGRQTTGYYSPLCRR